MWFLRRSMQILWMAKKPSENVMRSKHNNISHEQNMEMPGNHFWTCEEKREIETSCNNRNDQGKFQQDKNIGCNNKMSGCRKSDRCT